MKKEMAHLKKHLTAVRLATLFCLFFTKTVVGQGQFVPIVSVDPATQYSFNETHGDGMVGWVFNLQQTVIVNQVGWYDDGYDGLSRDYQIGLWQDLVGTPDSLLVGCIFQTSNPYSIVGDPVNGITIPAGTSASLNGAYRVVNLPSPITLVPGNYELGGLDTASTIDPIRYLIGRHESPVAGMTQGPFFYAYLGQPATSLQPTQSLYLLDGLELGPMLFTAVPEPSTLGLLILGGLFLGWVRRGIRDLRL